MNTSEVRAFFEQTDVYLTYNYNLRIRAETVADFIAGKRFENVLDMPCGTGDISAPFIDQFDRLTLMDFSSNMIATARKRFKPEDEPKLRFVHTDFYEFPFGDEQFDLVMNIGILAHIQDPFFFLQETVKLVKSGGYLIIQNTDSNHWFAKLIHFYLAIRRATGKDRYKLNKVSEKQLIKFMETQGCKLEKAYSYNQSFLGFSRFFSNEVKYSITRRAFGYPRKNGQRGSGSDATFLFRKAE